jgi:hypothetical protein|nr:MAG TPA: hypothetical protein [Caudoviricetes sp.]
MTDLKKILFEKMYNTLNQLGEVENAISEHKYNREEPSDFELAEHNRLSKKREKLVIALEETDLLDEYWDWDYYYRIEHIIDLI